MTNPQTVIWKTSKPKRTSKMQAEFNTWLEKEFPAPKVIEERLENGMVIKRYEQDPRLVG